MPENDQKTPSCFVAMPISTPDPSLYHGDADHFLHVLDHLFVPAIEAAGMEPIRPTAQGADVIQGEIIKHLETADLVLCDISTLNANVFFELGIRTALNKPVCIVRDDATPLIPFDTTIVNHHSYKRFLSPWDSKIEIQRISDHLTSSYKRSEGRNALWNYFGLSIRAEPSKQGDDVNANVAILSHQVEALSRRIYQMEASEPTFTPGTRFVSHWTSSKKQAENETIRSKKVSAQVEKILSWSIGIPAMAKINGDTLEIIFNEKYKNKLSTLDLGSALRELRDVALEADLQQIKVMVGSPEESFSVVL